jgi:hypothetical protein
MPRGVELESCHIVAVVMVEFSHKPHQLVFPTRKAFQRIHEILIESPLPRLQQNSEHQDAFAVRHRLPRVGRSSAPHRGLPPRVRASQQTRGMQGAFHFSFPVPGVRSCFVQITYSHPQIRLQP